MDHGGANIHPNHRGGKQGMSKRKRWTQPERDRITLELAKGQTSWEIATKYSSELKRTKRSVESQARKQHKNTHESLDKLAPHELD